MSRSSQVTRTNSILKEMGVSPGWGSDKVESTMRLHSSRLADTYASVLEHEFSSAKVICVRLLKRLNRPPSDAEKIKAEVSYVLRSMVEAGLLHVTKLKGIPGGALGFKRCKNPLLVPEVYPARTSRNTGNGVSRRSTQVLDATGDQSISQAVRSLAALERTMDVRIDSMITHLGKMQTQYREQLGDISEALINSRDKVVSAKQLQSELQSLMGKIENVIQH